MWTQTIWFQNFHSYVVVIHSHEPPMSGTNLGVSRMQQWPVQSLHPHRAYPLMGALMTQRHTAPCYKVKRMGEQWGEDIGWSKQAPLRVRHLTRGLDDTQQWALWDLGENSPAEGTAKRKELESLRWCPSCGRKATWLELREQGGSDGEGVGDTGRGRITDRHGELNFILHVIEVKTLEGLELGCKKNNCF